MVYTYTNMILYHARRFVHPIRGITYALRKDRSYRFQVYGVATLLLGATYFLKPLNQT